MWEYELQQWDTEESCLIGRWKNHSFQSKNKSSLISGEFHWNSLLISLSLGIRSCKKLNASYQTLSLQPLLASNCKHGFNTEQVDKAVEINIIDNCIVLILCRLMDNPVATDILLFVIKIMHFFRRNLRRAPCFWFSLISQLQ